MYHILIGVNWENLKQTVMERKKLLGLAAVILVAAVATGALGIYDSGGSNSQEFNRNDAMFMNMMIVHHDQAIEMAELSKIRTENENILELSQNISRAQTRENEQMKAWMNELGLSYGNHHRMAGMATREEMQQLRNSNGSQFNELFAQLMIEHHEGGIAMAQNFRDAGQHQELREMQKGMIDAQTREIELMRRWQNQGLL